MVNLINQKNDKGANVIKDNDKQKIFWQEWENKANRWMLFLFTEISEGKDGKTQKDLIGHWPVSCVLNKWCPAEIS